MSDNTRAVECSNCDWTGTPGQCGEMRPDSVLERVTPGETMPVGECPECGCVAHFVDRLASQQAIALLKRLVAEAPDEEPEIEDYDNTESASHKGVEVGRWEAAQIVQRALNILEAAPRQHVLERLADENGGRQLVTHRFIVEVTADPAVAAETIRGNIAAALALHTSAAPLSPGEIEEGYIAGAKVAIDVEVGGI